MYSCNSHPSQVENSNSAFFVILLHLKLHKVYELNLKNCLRSEEYVQNESNIKNSNKLFYLFVMFVYVHSFCCIIFIKNNKNEFNTHL